MSITLKLQEWAKHAVDMNAPTYPVPQGQRTRPDPLPTVRYQVLDGDQWVDVEYGTEIEGGCLRYHLDGWGKTSLPGHWRSQMPDELVRIAEAALVKQYNARVLWGAFLFACFVLWILVEVL